MPGSTSARRRARGAGCLVAAALVAMVAAVGTPSAAGATKKPKTVIAMTVGDQTVYGVGNVPQTLPDDVRAKVIAALTTYLTAATVRPLQQGAVDDTALATTFDANVASRATGADRAVLVDEGLPRATGKVRVTTAPVQLTGLVDGFGTFVVVTAKLDSTTTAKTIRGKVTIKRAGELVFSPDGGGGWKVSGYDLKVDRAGKGLAPPTSATTIAGTPTTATTSGRVAK